MIFLLTLGEIYFGHINSPLPIPSRPASYLSTHPNSYSLSLRKKKKQIKKHRTDLCWPTPLDVGMPRSVVSTPVPLH